MSNTNITTTTETTTVVVEENIVRIELNNIGVQGVPGANTDPTYVTVRNATGATLPKGTIVYISGANGNNVQVTPAIATSDATSARTLGWLSAAIANNASGLCMVEGYLEGINTQSFNAGDQLYLSGTVAGGFTATEPQAPIHLVYVGVVTKKSAGDGHVFVKVQNGYELEELHNVQIINPTNNQVLAYDSATQLWKNATNAPDGVTSITATAPLTGGTITSTGSIGLDQTALSITKSQVSDFTSGTVTSASTAQQAGTAVYAVNAGTAVYSTTAGTAVYSANSGTAVTISGTITKSQVSDFTSGTVAQADNATNAGTSVYATNSGTAVYADTSGTATYATNAGTAVFATTSGTATFATNSGTAVFATNASTAVSVSGSAITQSQVVNLVSDLANTAKLNTANAFTVGGHTIATGADGTKGLTINSNGASQTANLLEVVGNATTTTINQLGQFVTTGSIQTTGIRNPSVVTVMSFNTAGINVFSNNPTAANVGLVVRGASGQSANLQEWQSSTGSTALSVNSAGLITATRQLSINSSNSGETTFVLRGAASQTGDQLAVRDSSANTIAGFSATGRLYSGVSGSGQTYLGGLTLGSGSVATQLGVIAGAATTVGAVIRGAASQSANLQEWQTSAGTANTYVGSAGQIRTSVSIRSVSMDAVTSQLGIQSGNALTPTAILRGFASQTANLQEWQNDGGTALARVLSDGQLVSSAINTSNNYVRLLEANSGGTLQLTRMTAAAGNPGANVARLFLRDGTNAGTLKLVVRAGAAGAETTILDNIPQ